MTTPEAAPEAVPYKIVVCGTCNVLFMVHPGRPSCPSCGGEPFLVLQEGEIPASLDDQAAPTEEETAAPAEASAEETPAAAAGEPHQDFDEVNEMGQKLMDAQGEAMARAGLQ